MSHHVLIIWALAKALDHTDYCSPTDTVEGQLAGWCWEPLLTKDWQLQPCWLGNNTHKFTLTRTQMHKDTHTHTLLNCWMLSLSLFHLLLLYHVLSFTDVATAALYPSFSPPSLLLHWGCYFLSKESAFLFHVPSATLDRGDTPAAALPANKHSISLWLPLSHSLFLSHLAMYSVHTSSYLPSSPPSLILFIDIDVSALCLHPSLSFPLLLCLFLHSLLILELPGFLLLSLYLSNSPTFQTHTQVQFFFSGLAVTTAHSYFPLVSSMYRYNHFLSL